MGEQIYDVADERADPDSLTARAGGRQDPHLAASAGSTAWRDALAAADNVQLGIEPSPFRVAIPAVLRGSMAFRAAYSDPRFERGGILLGWVDEEGVTIVDVTEDLRGEPSNGVLDFESAARRARELGAGVVVLGYWHTHSNPLEVLPSKQDRRNLANRLLVDGLERSVGFVVTPRRGEPDSSGPWFRPVFSAYIARRDGVRTIVEPAAVGELTSDPWEQLRRHVREREQRRRHAAHEADRARLSPAATP